MDTMRLWELMFRLYLVLFAMLVLSFLFQRPASEARPITLVTATAIFVLLVVLALIIRREWKPF